MPRKKTALLKFFDQQKWSLVSLVVVLGMFGLVSFTHRATQLAQQRQLQIAEAEPNIGGPFTLTDHTGAPFTEQSLKNHYTLMFFGYTFCPDICPTTLATVAEVYENLPEEMRNILQVVFISVDPARDTPQSLADYMAAFNENFLGATGTPAQVKQAADAYHAYYHQNGAGDDYFIDHSGWLYLMSPGGTYLQHYPHTITPADLQKALQNALAK